MKTLEVKTTAFALLIEFMASEIGRFDVSAHRSYVREHGETFPFDDEDGKPKSGRSVLDVQTIGSIQEYVKDMFDATHGFEDSGDEIPKDNNLTFARTLLEETMKEQREWNIKKGFSTLEEDDED